MPNDAKLGLVAGLALVMTVAVVYFRKDAAAPRPAGEPAAAVHSPGAAPAGGNRVVKGKTTSHQKNDEGRMTNDERMTKPE